MKLIARKPIDTLPDGDKRPGDTFEAPKDVGAALVESGHAEHVDGSHRAEPEGAGGEGAPAAKPKRAKKQVAA